MAWYVVFRDQKSRVHDSWGVCSKYVVGFSGATFQSYSTRKQVDEAYIPFLDHQNELRKSEQILQKPEDVAKK
jgi:viroplasmin and RNaseH domain-containing protein